MNNKSRAYNIGVMTSSVIYSDLLSLIEDEADIAADEQGERIGNREEFTADFEEGALEAVHKKLAYWVHVGSKSPPDTPKPALTNFMGFVLPEPELVEPALSITARLIDAAPDILETLEAVSEWLTWNDTGDEVIAALRQRVEDTLHKTKHGQS